MMKAWTIVALLLLGGCASQSQQMRGLLQEGAVRETITEGEAWLKDRDNDDAAERLRVRKVLATAYLRRFGDSSILLNYEIFERRFGEVLTQRQAHTLMQATAAATWRERAEPAQTAQAMRHFRQEFPNSTLIAKARRRELQLALDEAQTEGSIEAQQAYRTQYAGWPEAGEWVSQSRQREAALAFEEAQGVSTVAAWRRFRETYAPWSEAESLMASAHDHQAEAALAEADGDIEALEAVARDYPFGDWSKKAQDALAKLVLADAVNPLATGHPVSDEALDELEPHLWRPGISAEAARHRARITARARAATRSAPLRLARLLFSDFDGGEREADLAWGEAEQTDTAVGWAAFSRRYPQDPRAAEAEAASWQRQRLDQAQFGWPQARVAYERRLPNGEVELTIDVADCDGRRISGLTADAFEIIDQRTSHRPEEFRGLEQDRPVDLSFVIDLSGSMIDEREAVQQAVVQFAETFRFRGREARMGLVTFADTVASDRSAAPRLCCAG